MMNRCSLSPWVCLGLLPLLAGPSAIPALADDDSAAEVRGYVVLTAGPAGSLAVTIDVAERISPPDGRVDMAFAMTLSDPATKLKVGAFPDARLLIKKDSLTLATSPKAGAVVFAVRTPATASMALAPDSTKLDLVSLARYWGPDLPGDHQSAAAMVLPPDFTPDRPECPRSCASGGQGSTSCSQSCGGGVSCNASCSEGYYACCNCPDIVPGPAHCICVNEALCP
jgi:hypothetical protein